MFKNNFLIALRSLSKNRVSSFINIAGLAVGMAVALLIALWVWDELTYDRYFPHYERIAQVMQHQTFNGHKGTGPAIPIPLEPELRNKYGHNFQYLAMASWQGEHILSFGDKKVIQEGNYMDKDITRILSLPMLQGTHDGLKELNSILLSKSAAQSLFGTAEPLGKLIKIDNLLEVKVTGVYEDLPFNTEFHNLHFIAPWELYVSSQEWVKNARAEQQWGNNSFQLFALIANQTNLATLSSKIKNVKYDKVDKEEKKFKAEIFLHPMKDWHLNSNWEEGVQTGGFMQYVRLFTIVGIFVLLLACINFMNLSTARSEKRAKEVGIRKTIGSVRGQLIRQFFSESFVVVCCSFLVAVVFILLVLPWFNEVADKKISFPWTQPLFWLGSLAFISFTGLVAGSYPAFYLSSFQPIKVLKGTFKAGRFASIPRKMLVVLQFTISITFIIGTLIVYQQIQHTKNRPLGYNNQGIVMVQMSSPDHYGKYDLLRNELKSNGTILEMAQSSSPLTGVWSNNGGFSWEGKDPNLDAEFATVWVTHDFGKTVDWQFNQGRDFSRDFSTDTSALVMNEAAVKFSGIKDPVGKTINWGDDRTYKIIGVIKDMLMESPYDPVRQTVYFLDYENVNWMNFKLNPAKSASESLANVREAFKKYIPSVPFDYEFADESFSEKFEAEERVGTLAAAFAGLAVFISCLGLFGLASFAAEQRTKEIGIRKVLGASVNHLWALLSRDFVILVLISCILAVPIAYHYLHGWLQQYKYHTEISWWVFGIAAFGAVAITLITVSFQAVRAATVNPMKSLKSE